MEPKAGDSGVEVASQNADIAYLRRKFYEDGGDEMLASARRGTWVSLVMSLAGYFLDYLLFRDTEHQELLLTIIALRVMAAGLLFFVLFLLQSARSPAFIRAMCHAAALIPMFVLLWILVEIGSAGSSYYAGLNLIMVGTVLVFRWPLKHAVINAVFCIGGYLAVAVGLGTPVPETGVAFFFLTCTALLACVGSYILHNLRFRDYCTGQKLDEKARQLADALAELHENEVRLLQAEKLSSLGRISAGIVHEVNNPLNYAVTALHMLRAYADDIPESERADYGETVGDAEEGVGRVIKIVSDLRAFTKGEINMGQEVQLAGVLESARRLVSADLRGIRFVTDVPEDLKVDGNDNQLCQIFMNFIQNATEAVVATKDRGEEPEITVRGTKGPAGEILLVIRDNGCGISTEDIKVIFEPFFTKRQVGEGMGLGLSICHSILKAHGAQVEVVSEPDKFTEFTIMFPPVRSSEARRPESDERNESDQHRATIPQ
jgi:two-component system sensor histidine kinase PhcS